MASSVVIFEKPNRHIAMADWISHLWKQQKTAETRSGDSFCFRNQSRQLRNETTIQTNWNNYHNNIRLADRITELSRWRDTLKSLVDQIDQEMLSLSNEKASTEREIETLSTTITAISECLQTRDSKRIPELTYDDAQQELKKELCVCEGMKKLLIERCQATWEKLNRLRETRFHVNSGLEDKNEAIEIAQDDIVLNKNSANVSFKPDALKRPKCKVSYEQWFEHTMRVKTMADNELFDTCKFKEALFICREKGKNDLRAQASATNFALRKRIFESTRARNELQWQAKKVGEEMEKMMDEIKDLIEALRRNEDELKLSETRLETMTYRARYEFACDEASIGLKNTQLKLLEIQEILTNKLNCAKATYNALEDLKYKLDTDISNKEHAIMADTRCTDIRNQISHSENLCETDQNIELVHMEDQIPS